MKCIDSIRIYNTEETILDLVEIETIAVQSTRYPEEIEILKINNKGKFLQFLKNNDIDVDLYPKIKHYLNIK